MSIFTVIKIISKILYLAMRATGSPYASCWGNVDTAISIAYDAYVWYRQNCIMIWGIRTYWGSVIRARIHIFK